MKESMLEKLKSHEQRFNELRKQWEHAKSCVYASVEYAGLHSYRVTQSHASADELHFTLYGAVGYMAFRHDLEHGVIEYGALQSDGQQHRHIPVKQFHFDDIGNLEGGCSLSHFADFEPCHLQILAELAPAIVAAYFGLERVADVLP